MVQIDKVNESIIRNQIEYDNNAYLLRPVPSCRQHPPPPTSEVFRKQKRIPKSMKDFRRPSDEKGEKLLETRRDS